MNQSPTNDQLTRIEINGFKSIAHCDLTLGPRNILIGCNGAGKSNFIGFFRMVQQMLEGNLQTYVATEGGPDSLLHFGRKVTERLTMQIHFGENVYIAGLIATADNRLVIYNESFLNKPIPDGYVTSFDEGGFHEEESLIQLASRHEEFPALEVLSQKWQWRIYHFHDTGSTAYVKQPRAINDNIYLREDARNLAAVLYLLREKYPDSYRRIVKAINLVAPFFGDFHLRPSPFNPDVIELEWVEKGYDVPFKAHHLSDGTLRFICLAVVFLQPEELQPDIIIVDEPELGLHPYAITIAASLIKTASLKKQVIVSTQSVDLLNEFDPSDVVVVDREDGKSIFKRPDTEHLKEWLQEYSLGELWLKNLIGGRPAR